MATPELLHFPLSHYNEKVRWALDYKRIPHVRRSLLPGLHRLTTLRVSGQGQVPVLRCCDGAVAGSARIIQHLEDAHPGASLYPESGPERERALSLQDWLDAEVGPAVRRARFGDMLDDPAYFCRQFTFDRGRLAAAAYRAIFPGVRAVMKRDMQIFPEQVEESLDVTRRALDFVAREGREGKHGYLVGDAFSVADLTAASLLFPAVEPAETIASPQPRSPVLVRWLARWADHPGVEWVRAIYARHRGSSAAVG